MNLKEKFLHTIDCENFDIPIFCPAIYDYKVNFSNNTINLFGQNADEFEDALEEESNLLNSEVITCGYDIYNIEAEAIGANVERGKENIFPEVTYPILSNLNEIHETLLEAYKAILLLRGVDLDKAVLEALPSTHLPLK